MKRAFRVLPGGGAAALFLCALLLVSGCSLPSREFPPEAAEAAGTAPPEEGEELREPRFPQPMELRYAQQFAVSRDGEGRALVTIAGEERFLVIPEGGDVPEGLGPEVTVLRQPMTGLYAAASSAMDFFRRLDALDAVGFTSTSAANWSLPEVRRAVEEGAILYAGKYSAPDYELLLSAGCPLAIESTMILHAPAVRERLEDWGIPVLVERSSYEPHPLGRMEWIKLYGLLLGREAEAAAFFNAQAAALEEVLTAENTGKTVAFFSLSSQGYATVRKSGDYVTEMIALAGGTYAFSQLAASEETALSTLNLQMELFYEGAREADVLIYNGTIDGGVETLTDLLDKCSLLSDCKAVQAGDVWCTERNLFQESAAAAGIIAELHAILTGTAEETLVYFHRLGT